MSTPAEAFAELESKITAIPKEKIVKRNRSMNDILGEITRLAETALSDRHHFEAVPRFRIELIDSLLTRLDAFLFCYAQYEEVSLDKSVAKVQFDRLKESAVLLKKKLIRRLYIIAEESENETEIKELKKITAGYGREDLTLDFLKLSEKGKLQSEELATLGFGDDDIARVERTFIQLKRVLGSINTPNAEVEKRKLLMRQAYTYLDMAESPIKTYGQMLFEDTERESLYKSDSLIERGKIEKTFKKEDTATAH